MLQGTTTRTIYNPQKNVNRSVLPTLEYPNSHYRTHSGNYQYHPVHCTDYLELLSDPSWPKESSISENNVNEIELSQDQEQDFSNTTSFDVDCADKQDESVSEEEFNLTNKLEDQIQNLQRNVQMLTKQIREDETIKQKLQERLDDLEKKIEANPSIHTDEQLGEIHKLVHTFVFPRLKIIPQEELDNNKGQCISNIVRQYKKQPNMSDEDITFNWKIIKRAVLNELGKTRNHIKAQFRENYKGNLLCCVVLVH